MELARIKDGNLEKPLPKSGQLLDGRFVSGYNLLSENILYEEGWRPYVEIKPDLEGEFDYHILDNFMEINGIIQIIYRIDTYAREVDKLGELETVIDTMLGGDPIEQT